MFLVSALGISLLRFIQFYTVKAAAPEEGEVISVYQAFRDMTKFWKVNY